MKESLMKESIWKYEIQIVDGEQVIELPIGYEPLAFQLQQGVPTLWALVRPHNKKVGCRFYIFGTGHVLDTPGISKKYVGTIQQGPYVWHLFDGGEIEV